MRLKTIDNLPVQNREHRGNAGDTEFTRCLLVVGCIRFDQGELPIRLVGQLLQDGTEHAARCAPIGPKVDDDQTYFRSRHHIRLEAGVRGIDNPFRLFGHSVYRLS